MRKFEGVREFPLRNEYPLAAEEAGDYTQETYNLWLYDPVARLGLNLWLAVSGAKFPNFMSTVLIYEQGGRAWAGRYEGSGNPPNGVGGGGVIATIVAPYERLAVDVLGVVVETDQTGKRDAFNAADATRALTKMTLDVDILSPPIEQGSQGDDGTNISSASRPRNALRYEQLVRVSGPVTIGERRIDLVAYGMRSHRRNSSSIYDAGSVGHTWATASFPSGKGFHLLSYQVQPNAEVNFLYGHYFDGDRYAEAEVIGYPFYSGALVPEIYDLTLRVGTETIVIQCESLPAVPGMIPNTDVMLTRSAARFTMHGEIGGGVLERSLSRKFAPGGFYTAA